MSGNRLALATALAAVGVLVYVLLSQPSLPPDLIPPEGRYDVRILRDTWGVPHIFGRTDADVAYGLADAHAEDDFATLQGALLAACGELAAVYGLGAEARVAGGGAVSYILVAAWMDEAEIRANHDHTTRAVPAKNIPMAIKRIRIRSVFIWALLGVSGLSWK